MILWPKADAEEAVKLTLQQLKKRMSARSKYGLLRNYTAYFHDRCGFPLGLRQSSLVE